VALLCIVTSCDDSFIFSGPDDNNPGPTNPTIAVTGVSLNKSSISLSVGGLETLLATVTPSNATNKDLTWNSTNTSVAKVSTNGTVTAVSAGTATITVATVDGNKKASCFVTVSGGTNPNPGGNLTEAYVTVTGLSSKIGKYLSVSVCNLGDPSSGSYYPLLISPMPPTTPHAMINNNSMTIHVFSNGSRSIEPDGIYDIALHFYDDAYDTRTSGYKVLANVRFVSGNATVSYTP
jgi:hypothetical protein